MMYIYIPIGFILIIQFIFFILTIIYYLQSIRIHHPTITKSLAKENINNLLTKKLKEHMFLIQAGRFFIKFPLLCLTILHCLAYVVYFPILMIVFWTVLIFETLYISLTKISTICPYCFTNQREPLLICDHCKKVHCAELTYKTILFKRCECSKFISIRALSFRKRHQAECSHCKMEISTTDSLFYPILVHGLDISMRFKPLQNECFPNSHGFSEQNWISSFRDKRKYWLPDRYALMIHFPQTIAGESNFLISSHFFNLIQGIVFIIDPFALDDYSNECNTPKNTSETQYLWKFTDSLLNALAYNANNRNIKSKIPFAGVLIDCDKVYSSNETIKSLNENGFNSYHQLGIDFLEKFSQHDFVQKITENFKKFQYFMDFNTTKIDNSEREDWGTIIQWVFNNSKCVNRL